MVASSSSVYGATPTLPKREDLPTRPMSPYAASKLAAEAYTNAYFHSFGMDTLALRFFNVFGPLQPAGHAYAAAVPAFVDAALAGRPVVIYGDGTQTRDFTFVDTVTSVLAAAVTRRVTDPEPVNLAFGTRTDLLTVVAMIEEILGHPRATVTTWILGRATCATRKPTGRACSSASRTSSRCRWRTACGRRSTGCARSAADLGLAGPPAQRYAAALGELGVAAHHPADDLAFVELPVRLVDGGGAHRAAPARGDSMSDVDRGARGQ